MKEHAQDRQEIIIPLAQFMHSHLGSLPDIRIRGFMEIPVSNRSLVKSARAGQLMEAALKQRTWEREEALMLAVLQDAVDYFQKYMQAKKPRGKQLFAEAEEWIMDQNRDWLFSFENICDVLELNPDYIRLGLLRWKDAQLKSRPYRKVDSPSAAKQPRPSISARAAAAHFASPA